MVKEGYMSCPICDAEVAVSYDDHAGDELYCSFCQAMLKLKKRRKAASNEDEYYFDEDF